MKNMEGKVYDHYQFQKYIDKGQFGTVYRGIDLQNNQKVAIKVISLNSIEKQPKRRKYIQTEIRFLEECKKLNNQNIIKMIDAFISKKENILFIILEYCEDGDLEKYLQKKGSFSQSEATDILKQILHGFCGIHQIGGIHRDIKLANILKKGQIIKISDFGLSKIFQKNQTLANSDVGTPFTKAPQLIKNQEYDEKVDIWSIGIIYYEMIYGKNPFFATNVIDFYQKMVKNKIDFRQGVKISNQAKDFIKRCLTVDPQKRISWVQIYQHPLITNENSLNKSSISKEQLTMDKSSYQKGSVKKFVQNEVQSNFQDFLTTLGCFEQKDGLFLSQKNQKNISKQIKQTKNFLSQQISRVNKQNEKLKIKQHRIENYQKLLWMNKRKILFMFQYFIPKLQKLKGLIYADHENPLFLISKKALIQLHSLNKTLEKQKNQVLALKSFFESNQFKKFKDSLENQIDKIYLQCLYFMEGLKHNFQPIKIQTSDLSVWQNKNWMIMVKDFLKNYQNQISEFIDENQLRDHQKEVLQMIIALQYYAQNMMKDEILVQQFDTILKTLDHEDYKMKLQNRLMNSSY